MSFKNRRDIRYYGETWRNNPGLLDDPVFFSEEEWRTRMVNESTLIPEKQLAGGRSRCRIRAGIVTK